MLLVRFQEDLHDDGRIRCDADLLVVQLWDRPHRLVDRAYGEDSDE